MKILGISAFYHDSAAALLDDGRIVAAAQEERFTRKKHDRDFPSHAIRYCLEAAGCRAADVDLVAFYEKPLLRFDRLLETYLAYAPRGFLQFLKSLPVWLRQKLHLPKEMDDALQGQYQGRYIFIEHHESHAASAFFPSPFDRAAIMTLDGVGEWATASFGTGQGGRIDLSHVIHFPHSLGLLYSAFTYYVGFRVNSGEYKLMGLAPYGEPRFKDLILRELLDLKEDGSFRLNMRYFPYGYRMVMINRAFEKLFEAPARRAETAITQHTMDVAASIQSVTEEIMLRIAKHVHRVTGEKNLVLAGGVALNCVGNGRILRESPFEEIWIQPAAGDAGGALGAALFVWHQLLDRERSTDGRDQQQGSLLGPSFSDPQIKETLDRLDAKYVHFETDQELYRQVAELIDSEKVIGWFQGRMEFGPRALGNRSILGDARSEKMQSVMNLKIKFRESFRPFAPCVLRDKAQDYFDLDPEHESPYMLIVAPVKEDRRLKTQENGQGLKKLDTKRSELPAITHVDYSARIQTVDEQRHPRLFGLMSQFDRRTDCPVVINTSFNIRGEPIVCTPQEAYHCFMATDMACLVLGNYLLHKDRQAQLQQHHIDRYKGQFSLD